VLVFEPEVVGPLTRGAAIGARGSDPEPPPVRDMGADDLQIPTNQTTFHIML